MNTMIQHFIVMRYIYTYLNFRPFADDKYLNYGKINNEHF